QDVPRAVELMSAMISLGRMDPTLPPFTSIGTLPSADILADFEAICILSGILQPYINIRLSLSEQVTHLSHFSHILYASYQEHCRRLMPNQLYYDSQTMVKNVIINVTKQQKLDPSVCLSFLDLGDDPLELEFAFLRMTGGHNNAVNYGQAIDRLGATRDIGGVYACNPDIAHGHRRLNLSRKEGVDHISWAHWLGDTVTGHCNLPTSWLQGRKEAL
ncbi:hypothetical protein PAXINDRAFT_28538, partial [Paxillus involutus ATCC 200175]